MAWRERVLRGFAVDVCRLTLVADPDRLLGEEGLRRELVARGFVLVEFVDSVHFRFVCEKLRDDVNVVVVCADERVLDALPADLLQEGRRLVFDLVRLFPGLGAAALRDLPRERLDALDDAMRFVRTPLGEDGSFAFVLRYVFGVDVAAVDSEVRGWVALLRLHGEEGRLPRAVARYLVGRLRAVAAGFVGVPLERLVGDRAAFFGWLQAQWRLFAEESGGGAVREGEGRVPFADAEVRGLVEGLLVEGRLSSVCAAGGEARFGRLLARARAEAPDAAASYGRWLAFARVWAELGALAYDGGGDARVAEVRALGREVNGVFWEWLQGNYAGLASLPPDAPAMVHHVARHAARCWQETGRRVALVVVDGLAFDQWVTVRECLREEGAALAFDETAVFAWIPTLTSVSRQAIFAGEAPMFFGSSVFDGRREEALWRAFWRRQGMAEGAAAFGRGLRDGGARVALGRVVGARTRAVGLVVDMVDRIMHGMRLGAVGMHAMVREWCRGGFLRGCLEGLLEGGFEVWLTADHGNVACAGVGRPGEGAAAEVRGERVRVYADEALRARQAAVFGRGRVWDCPGLPRGFFSLLAGEGEAFVGRGESVVAHGGAALEEVVVPLVRVRRGGEDGRWA